MYTIFLILSTFQRKLRHLKRIKLINSSSEDSSSDCESIRTPLINFNGNCVNDNSSENISTAFKSHRNCPTNSNEQFVVTDLASTSSVIANQFNCVDNLVEYHDSSSDEANTIHQRVSSNITQNSLDMFFSENENQGFGTNYALSQNVDQACISFHENKNLQLCLSKFF